MTVGTRMDHGDYENEDDAIQMTCHDLNMMNRTMNVVESVSLHRRTAAPPHRRTAAPPHRHTATSQLPLPPQSPLLPNSPLTNKTQPEPLRPFSTWPPSVYPRRSVQGESRARLSHTDV
jgi:hypothetical protein